MFREVLGQSDSSREGELVDPKAKRTRFCTHPHAIGALLGLLTIGVLTSTALAQRRLDERLTPLPEDPAVLTVRNALPYAHVTVDGVLVGNGVGEFEQTLAAGQHTIRVCQRGYHCAVQAVGLELGERRTWAGPDRLDEVRTSPILGIVTAVVALGTISGGVALFNDSGELRSDGVAMAGLGIVGVGLGLGLVSIAILSEPGPELPAEAELDVSFPPTEVPHSGAGSVWGVVFGLSF